MECRYYEGLSDSGINAIVSCIYKMDPNADSHDVRKTLSICNTLIEIGGSWHHVAVCPKRFFAKTKQEVEKLMLLLRRLVDFGIVEERFGKYRCLVLAL